MAQFHNLAQDYQGPNEEYAGVQLALQLPDDWHVISGRQLPLRNRPEIDFMILAKNNLFILEEKSWGPKVIMQDLRWVVMKQDGNQERQNPARGLSLKTKATRGWLESKVVGYKNTKGHRVHGFIFMTHKDLDLRIAPGFEMNDLVLKMDDFAYQLIEFDRTNTDSTFQALQSSIFKLLLDLPQQRHQLRPIADFRILREIDLNSFGLPNDKRILRFEAEHSTVGTEYQLKCFVKQYWKDENGNIGSDFRKREFLVSEKLRDLGIRRTWEILPPIDHPEMDWLIFPIRKPLGAVSLSEYRDTLLLANSVDKENLGSEGQQLSIVIDALQALAEIHESKIVHKGITPERVWITRGNRIMFSDFYISHVDGELSIEVQEEDVASKPFRAPECANTIALADQSSDLYSLILVLFGELLNIESVNPQKCEEYCLSHQSTFWNQLLPVLQNPPSSRSTAIRIVKALESFMEKEEEPTVNSKTASPQPNSFEISSILGSRFELERQLGVGGSATTWVARDLESQNRQVLLKVANSPELFPKLQEEFSLSQRATKGLPTNVLYSRAEQAINKPDPGFLVFNFIEGNEFRVVAKDPNFSVLRGKKIFQKTLSALSFLHAEGYIHGDPTPRNLIIQEGDEVALIDFGSAVEIGKLLKNKTPRYEAPEISSQHPADPSTDLYILSAGFLNMILGRSHRQDSDFSLLPLTDVEKRQYTAEEITFLDILFECVRIDQAQRPSITEVIARLTKFTPSLALAPKFNYEYKVNPTIEKMRLLYTGSKLGASNAIAESVKQDSLDFTRATYVPTKLDTVLLNQIISGKVSVLFLTGNPGDGKTTFLLKVYDALVELGGRVKSSSGVGWEIEYNNRIFVSVLDASQSYDGQSADSITAERLERVTSASAVALFAINDGRLKQFFQDNFEAFPIWGELIESYFAGEPISEESFQVVDLKTRTLVGFNENGLLPQMLSKMTSPALWEVCNSCAAVDACPLYRNAQAASSYAKPAVNRLLLIGHLRRHKRATFRRVRSALAWLITGDIDCIDVHEAVRDTSNGINLDEYHLQNLAFSSKSREMLIQEFVELDPSQQISPTLKSEILRAYSNTSVDELEKYYREFARKIFFAIPTDLDSDEILEETFVYRYFQDYIDNLSNPGSTEMISRLLIGMSKIAGYYGEDIEGLAVAESKHKSAWAVVKSIPLDEFSLRTPEISTKFIEVIADSLIIQHSSGAKFVLNLDAFELLCRSADGEIFADIPSETIRFDVLAFVSRLIRVPVKEVHLVDPAGDSWRITNDSARIELKLPETSIS